MLRIPPQCGDLVAICLEYRLMPTFKWAGMAAIASHHVRLVLFPFRLDTDRSGYVNIPHSLVRPGLLLMEDVIRMTNNAIFDDIFWVHFAYFCADDGIECLRALLGQERHYAPILSGFEAIDQGRRVLADGAASADARKAAEDLIWAGNVQLLEHENAPWCSRTSIACRALLPGSSRSARRPPSRCVEFGGTSRTSPRSTCRRSLERPRTACHHGRGSTVSTTVGAGSWPASRHAFGNSMPTRA